jgi:hypothetical protein
MTYPVAPGLPSDKLIPPLNAPKAANVSPGVQPGVSSGIVLAQYVVVFGTSGGVFIYDGTPAPGNPPIYWFGNVTADPYGNQVDQGIWAGQPGSIQVGIQTSQAGPAGLAEVFFVPVGTYDRDAVIAMQQVGGQAILQILGARTTAVPAANSDYVLTDYYDHGAGTTAAIADAYFDANGVGHNLMLRNCQGTAIFACGTFNAVDPTTGTSSVNPALPETWHALALDTGWSAGSPSPEYRLFPGGNVQLRGIATRTSGSIATLTSINNSNPLPVAYRPGGVRYYRAGQAVDSAAAVDMGTGGVLVARASGAVTATQAILDGSYTL